MHRSKKRRMDRNLSFDHLVGPLLQK